MRWIPVYFLLILLSALQSCGNNAVTDSVQLAKDSNRKKDTSAEIIKSGDSTKTIATNPIDKSASDFIVEASNANMMEIELGAYAQQNAMSKKVKDFGTMMVKDHSSIRDRLKAIATAKNISLPDGTSNSSKKEMSDLVKKTGTAFDKAYMQLMLDNHQNDFDKFSKISNDCADIDIKNFAKHALPVLMLQLNAAKTIMGK